MKTSECLLKAVGFLIAISCAVRVCSPTESLAVPIGFLLQREGNQRDVKWKRWESPRFTVYADEKAENVGRYALTSVENAYPDLSLLLGVRLKNDGSAILGEAKDSKQDSTSGSTQGPTLESMLESRFERVPIVVNTRSQVGGFANFSNQNIEIQAALGSQASLYQHELVHRLMYEHIDVGVGPGGRAVALSMIPTWWLEGLPEYLTESTGRLETAGVARSMVRHEAFLSFDRLNSLYNASSDVTLRGYVTSGRFFKFLIDSMKGADLSSVHKELFRSLITPPFLTGVSDVLKSRLKKSPSELYEEYKKWEVREWASSYEKMPPLRGDTEQKVRLSADGIPQVVTTDEGVFVSNLGSNDWESSLMFIDAKSGVSRRLPLRIQGGWAFDFHPSEQIDGSFWTTQRKKFSNGTSGHELVQVQFKGNLKDISAKAISRKISFPLSTALNPLSVTQITALGGGQAFVLGNLRGDTVLYFVDAQKRKFEIKHKWPSPDTVRILPLARSAAQLSKKGENLNTACVSLLVDHDLERTEIEKRCANGSHKTLLPVGKAYLRDGFEREDGSFQLLVGWKEVLALANFDQASGLSSFVPFAEWADGLRPYGTNGDVRLFEYRGDGYSYVRVNPTALKEKFALWSNALPEGSAWRKPFAYEPYFAPYARFAAQKRKALLSDSAPATPKPFQDLASRKVDVKEEEASYRNDHWFTYPYVMPPRFGGWSLGLVSVPFVDEMERQRLEVYGVYNAYTRGVSGTVQYINNRVLDAFLVSLHSRERFNGLYYILPCIIDGEDSYCASQTGDKNSSYRFSYLRENGVGLTTAYRLRPSSIALDLSIGFNALQPSTGTLSSAIGAQATNLVTLGGNISLSLFETSFYTRAANTTGGDFVGWNTRMSSGAEENVSIGQVRDGRGNVRKPLNFYKLHTGITSVLNYRAHTLTWRLGVNGTLGENALNLRERYTPYNTYLLGSGTGLNNLNYPIVSTSALFRYSAGYWSYRNNLSYDFPILRDLDTQFLIAYLDSIQGEIVVGRGGVAKDKGFKKLESVNSASVAARMNIDIKGLGIFPSLAYGRILGEPGWSLFSEISFSQFF